MLLCTPFLTAGPPGVQRRCRPHSVADRAPKPPKPPRGLRGAPQGTSRPGTGSGDLAGGEREAQGTGEPRSPSPAAPGTGGGGNAEEEEGGGPGAAPHPPPRSPAGCGDPGSAQPPLKAGRGAWGSCSKLLEDQNERLGGATGADSRPNPRPRADADASSGERTRAAGEARGRRAPGQAKPGAARRPPRDPTFHLLVTASLTGDGGELLD